MTSLRSFNIETPPNAGFVYAARIFWEFRDQEKRMMARRINFLPAHDELARVVPKRVAPSHLPSEVIEQRHNGNEHDRGKQRERSETSATI